MTRWGERFLDSTRGQVVQLLRRGQATVSDVATSLELTDNAIRAHLTTLERDGLVVQCGTRPGARRPETLYCLTREAEQLFPKSYHVLINRLLDVLADRLSPADIEEVLRQVGRSLAPQPTSLEKEEVQSHIKRALEIVESLGGLAVVTDGETPVIVGFSCPLGAVAREHPEICQLVETLLTEVIGVPVREECERTGKPRCKFRIENEREGSE